MRGLASTYRALTSNPQNPRWRPRLWALGLALMLPACGEDAQDDPKHQPPPWEERATQVLYGALGESDADLYPSDRYTRFDAASVTERRIDLSPRTLGSMSQLYSYPGSVEQLNELDGFSPTGGVIVRFNRPIDFAGYRAETEDGSFADDLWDASRFTQPGAPLYLVDVDPSSPDYGEPVGLVPVHYAQEKSDFWLMDDYSIIAHPAVPLRPRGRYLFLVTEAQRDARGEPVGRSELMHQALTGQAQGEYEEELSQALAGVLPRLELTLPEVSAATLFTVGDVQRELFAAAAARREAPPPELTSPLELVEQSSPTEGRVRFTLRYAAPEYRREKPNGKWQLGADGLPVIQHTEQLEAFLTFSHQEHSGPRPVVIYGHGLGGDKGGVWGTTGRLSELSARGVAVIGIDSPEHGSRYPGEINLVRSVYGFFGIDENTNDFDIGRARDNFRQMALDQLELVRLLGTLSELDVLPLGAPDGVPDLDVSQLFYIGHSFGSVQGATIGALAPEIHAATWNVGGAGLMMLLRDSKMFSLVVKGIAPNGSPYGTIAAFMATVQGIVDPGDPLNYAPYYAALPAPGQSAPFTRDLLIQQVIDDTIVPNSTTEALARAARVSLLHQVRPTSGLTEIAGPVTGNLPSGGTGVISQFDVMNGDERASHGELIFTPEAQAQYVEFFKTALTGRAVVNSPY